MPRVSMGDFRKFDVPIPPLDLQIQFADFVKQVDKSKVAIQKSLEKTRLLFDSLMQKYFGSVKGHLIDLAVKKYRSQARSIKSCNTEVIRKDTIIV